MHRTTRSLLLTAVLAVSLSTPSSCRYDEPAGPVAAPRTVPGAVLSPAPLVPAPVGRPTRVLVPAIGVDEALTGVGLQPDGEMAMPDFGDAAWYDRGPRPGAPGPAVVVAHVHGPAGDDVFARLHELRPGDRITVRRTDGSSTFVVRGSELAPKEALPYERIWSTTDQPVLRLITCGGRPDPQGGGYPANTIVYADLAP